MPIGKSSINRASQAGGGEEQKQKFFSKETEVQVSNDEIKLDFIPVANIRPTYDAEMITCAGTFDDVVNSMKNYGFLIPLLLRKLETEDGPIYRILSGHKRFYAAQKLGLSVVPAEIIVCDDKRAAEIYLEVSKYDSKSKEKDNDQRIKVFKEESELPNYLL